MSGLPRVKYLRGATIGAAASVVVVILLAAAAPLLLADTRVRGVLPPVSVASMFALNVLPLVLLAVLIVVVGGTFIGVVYAFIFEFITRRTGWIIGVLLGTGHGVFIWLNIAILAWWFPGLARYVSFAMFTLFNTWAGAGAFFLVHAVYGAIVGALYDRPLHDARVRTIVVWRELFPASKHFS